MDSNWVPGMVGMVGILYAFISCKWVTNRSKLEGYSSCTTHVPHCGTYFQKPQIYIINVPQCTTLFVVHIPLSKLFHGYLLGIRICRIRYAGYAGYQLGI